MTGYWDGRPPMIGWPHDTVICEHGVPVDHCPTAHGDGDE